MIIGRAFCKVIDGLTISVDGSDVVVKTDMGNQDALDKFIALGDKVVGFKKYPLIFYVTKPVSEDRNGWQTVNTDVIIMKNTDKDLLYKDRSDKTYATYIDPIYQKLKYTLTVNPYIQVIADTLSKKFTYTDVPNFGITKSEVGSKKSSKSVVTDYVDARIINLKFRIKTKCI